MKPDWFLSNCFTLNKPIIPIVYEFSRSEDTELREGAISCIDSILRRSPSSISNLEELIKILEEGLAHDPNYCGEFDDDDSDEEDDEDEDEDYSDDEDISWKVHFLFSNRYKVINILNTCNLKLDRNILGSSKLR